MDSANNKRRRQPQRASGWNATERKRVDPRPPQRTTAFPSIKARQQRFDSFRRWRRMASPALSRLNQEQVEQRHACMHAYVSPIAVSDTMHVHGSLSAADTHTQRDRSFGKGTIGMQISNITAFIVVSCLSLSLSATYTTGYSWAFAMGQRAALHMFIRRKRPLASGRQSSF